MTASSKDADGAGELPSPRHTSKGSTSGAPLIDETDRNDVLAAIREVFSNGGPRNRKQTIRDVANELGLRRLGPRIREVISRDIRIAVRRGILDNEGGQYTLLCRSIDEYTRDHLIEMLLAAMGSTWHTRDEAAFVGARHLGYCRTGRRIKAAFKSAINAALRRGLVQRDGPDYIRKS